MEKQTSLTVLSGFGVTKVEIANMANQIIADVEDGNIDPLTALVGIRAAENALKLIKNKLNNIFNDSAHEYTEKSFIKNNIKFTKTGRRAYDYSVSSDWIALNEKKKALETLMKAIKEPMANTETGEMVYPAPSKYSESISITFPND